MKKVGVGIVLILSVLLAVSCGKKIDNGPVSVGLIPLTATPTHTPDVNFTAYIHQESTPVVNVDVQMLNATLGITATAKTGADGKAGFKLHHYGSWVMNVGSFNGFKAQNFPVDPFSNTLHAVNYGIPSLELQLVSGSESVGVSASTVIYQVTYRTRFERPAEVRFNCPEGLVANISMPKSVSKDNDKLTVSIFIPNSFENYGQGSKISYIWAYCWDRTFGESARSNLRTLVKNWNFIVSADFYYMQVYDYADNNGRVSYYAGLKNIQYELNNPGSKGTITMQAIEAGNVGVDGTKTSISVGKCMPSFTKYGCFDLLLKIPTNGTLSGSKLKDNNSGWIIVEFSSIGDFKVRRKFETSNAWGYTCFHWCCTSRDISRTYEICDMNPPLPVPQSWCSLLWDDPVVADIERYKYQKVTFNY